jgi:hypothetical protein
MYQPNNSDGTKYLVWLGLFVIVLLITLAVLAVGTLGPEAFARAHQLETETAAKQEQMQYQREKEKSDLLARQNQIKVEQEYLPQKVREDHQAELIRNERTFQNGLMWQNLFGLTCVAAILMLALGCARYMSARGNAIETQSQIVPLHASMEFNELSQQLRTLTRAMQQMQIKLNTTSAVKAAVPKIQNADKNEYVS